MTRLLDWYEAMLDARPERHYCYKSTTRRFIEAVRHARTVRQLRKINRTTTLQ